jgi:hypothetical protein
VPLVVTDPNAVSTGVPPLDAALGGLFWGDNVVWELDDGGSVDPFVTALLRGREQFDRIVLVRFEGDADGRPAANAGADILDARPGSTLEDPGLLLAAVRERAREPRALVIFDSFDTVSARWGDEMVTRFFTRACPMLLDLWAVAYWSLTPSHHSMVLRQAIDAITQCVLVLGGGPAPDREGGGAPSGCAGQRAAERGAPDCRTSRPARAAAGRGAAGRAQRGERLAERGENDALIFWILRDEAVPAPMQ